MSHDSLPGLLARLDAVDAPQTWEPEYARHCVAMDHNDAARVFESGRPYSWWFGLRFDAGPPGVALPPLSAALGRILTTREGTPLDAYRVVYDSAVGRANLGPEALVALLVNSTLCVMRSRPSLLGLWLAGRAGIAAIALGLPQSAWNLLSLMGPTLMQHPELRMLRQLGLLRGEAGLETSPAVKVALADLWPELGVPAIPVLPVQALSEEEWHRFPATIERLEGVGAHDLVKLALRFVVRLKNAKQHADAFMSDLRREVARLDDGRTLSQPEVMKAIQRITVPELSAGFLELVRDVEWRKPVEAFLHPLSLALAARGTEFDDPHGVGMAKYAAERILEHRFVGLYDLAVDLLDHLVKRAGAWPPLGDLHFQRARARHGRGRVDDDESQLIIHDFEIAGELALERGDEEMIALATSGAAKATALALKQHRSMPAGTWNRMQDLLSRAGEHVSNPRNRALLFQAQGHLAHIEGPEHAIVPFEQAIACLPDEDPLWIEVSAELLDAMARSGFQRRAARRGLALLDSVSASAGSTELAMLRCAVSGALLATGAAQAAREQLTQALDLVRGHDSHTEMNIRLRLAHLGMVAGLRPLVEEQLRVLRDRDVELDALMREDLGRLEAWSGELRSGANEPIGDEFMLFPSQTIAADAGTDSVEQEQWRQAQRAAQVYVDGVLEGQRGSPSALTQLAVTAIRDAVDAARALSGASQLTETALLLAELGLGVDDIEERKELGEQAWALVQEGAAAWLVAVELRERVIRLTRRFAAMVLATARRAHPDEHEALPRPEVEDAVAWLARGHEVARAPVIARVVRPREASAAAWDRWLAALATDDPARIQTQLSTMREGDPTFLLATGEPAATWQWLEGRPAGVAVHPVRADGRAFVIAIHVRDGERAAISVEVDDTRVAQALAAPDADLRATANAVREALIAPLLAALDKQPDVVLWVPDPELRRIPPALLWAAVPVVTGVGLPTARGRSMPRRRRSTLVALADPGPGNNGVLRGGGVAALKALSETAAARGPVRTLGSVGPTYGRKLLGDLSAVRDTPASAEDLLQEVANHDVLAIVAHGDGSVPEDAALVLVGKLGEEERLEITRLGSPPDRFTGVGVLLLSCGSGRVGEALANPGGIAGALIAAGAQWVIAPLIEVGVGLATEVGVTVLERLAEGLDPWEALSSAVEGKRPGASDDSDAPALGSRPSTPPKSLQRASFVTWVG